MSWRLFPRKYSEQYHFKLPLFTPISDSGTSHREPSIRTRYVMSSITAKLERLSLKRTAIDSQSRRRYKLVERQVRVTPRMSTLADSTKQVDNLGFSECGISAHEPAETSSRGGEDRTYSFLWDPSRSELIRVAKGSSLSDSSRCSASDIQIGHIVGHFSERLQDKATKGSVECVVTWKYIKDPITSWRKERFLGPCARREARSNPLRRQSSFISQYRTTQGCSRK